MTRICIWGIALAIPVLAAPLDKIAPDLMHAKGDGTLHVIVQYHAAPGLTHHQKVASRGGILKAPLGIARAAAYVLPASQLRSLAEDPDVAYISPDRPVQRMLDVTAPSVNAGIAWQYGWNGAGIGIAIIDSGIADDPDLHDPASGKTRVVYQQAFNVKGTVDVYGHGTHVSGIAAGNGGSTRYVGIAPAANLINLRVLDDSGLGVDSSVISAIQTAIQLKNTYNIRVINLSLGRAVFESYKVDPLCQAVEAAWRAGIVVVVSAGNSGRDNSASTNGYATITAPANDPYAITVGAMKTMGTISRGDDMVASYSSKGPTLFDHIVKPDLVAPGNKMVSTLGKGGHTLSHSYPQNTITGTFFRLSGTSMAAPVVSGAAALLLQKSPGLTPDQVKAILMKTASKTFPASSVATDPVTGRTYTSYYDMFTIGAGYVDVWAALNTSDAPGTAFGAAISPTAYYDSSRGGVFLSNTGMAAIWGSNTVWGDQIIWGSNTVWGDQILGGSNTVWGDGGVHGFVAVWGNAALFGASTATATEASSVTILGEN